MPFEPPQETSVESVVNTISAVSTPSISNLNEYGVETVNPEDCELVAFEANPSAVYAGLQKAKTQDPGTIPSPLEVQP